MKFNLLELKNYIDKNFENADLNVNSVAMEFNISLSYMSRKFKRRMQIGMADYISLCRINKAKEYLKGTDLCIGEILYKVGFESANVFVRAFKRFEGLTPKRYRDINK